MLFILKRIKNEKQRLKEVQINEQKAEQQRLDEEERKLQYQELKLKEAEQNIKDIETQRLRENEILFCSISLLVFCLSFEIFLRSMFPVIFIIIVLSSPSIFPVRCINNSLT